MNTISEAEWHVMKVLWKSAPKTLPQIIDELEYTKWGTTTIQTYLSRLVKKGVLETVRQGKGFLYTPKASETECQIAESKSFLNKVYNGSVASMVSGFIKSGNLTDKELKLLKNLIQEQENKNDNR